MPMDPHGRPETVSQLTRTGCVLVLSTAFLGWLFAGVQMGINSLALRNAAEDLLAEQFRQPDAQAEAHEPQAGTQEPAVNGAASPASATGSDRREATIGQWFGWLTAAFLLGAAAGGYLFGWYGDRVGRARAMAYSILCYSIFSGLSVFVQDPWTFLLLRFLTCLGVGGIWPNGIALVSEAWPNISRPFLAGAIGTAANIGIMLMSLVTMYYFVTTENWRWVMWVGSAPTVLGLFVLVAVPESPRWLALKAHPGKTGGDVGIGDVFRPPVLGTTLLGIAIGTIPLFGGWGSSNWANAWASKVGDQAASPAASSGGGPAASANSESSVSSNVGSTAHESRQAGAPDGGAPTQARTKKAADPALKSWVLLSRSLPGSISSLLGGGLALLMGRRLCYFAMSAAALASAQILFWRHQPGTDAFLFWNGALGFFSGFFFGWLPLCLPEMFPTRVRSAGAGVSFNFGRILTAVGVLATGALLKQVFGGSYAAVGRTTSLVYALGMILILFAPDTSRRSLDE